MTDSQEEESGSVEMDDFFDNAVKEDFFNEEEPSSEVPHLPIPYV